MKWLQQGRNLNNLIDDLRDCLRNYFITTEKYIATRHLIYYYVSQWLASIILLSWTYYLLPAHTWNQQWHRTKVPARRSMHCSRHCWKHWAEKLDEYTWSYSSKHPRPHSNEESIKNNTHIHIIFLPPIKHRLTVIMKHYRAKPLAHCLLKLKPGLHASQPPA